MRRAALSAPSSLECRRTIARSRACASAGVTVGVLIEVDIGMGRCGVQPGGEVLKLARAVTGRPGFIAFYGGFHGRTLGAASVTTSTAAR